MAAYKITAGGVIRAADGACVPADEGNADWRAYQVWLTAGNTPDQADPPPVMAVARDLAAEVDALKDALAAKAVLSAQDVRVIDAAAGSASIAIIQQIAVETTG